MTIDPGAKEDVAAWTTFTRGAEIPDWVSKAYRDSYRGPRGDGSHGTSESGSVVTPSVLDAHCRLAQHRPSGESAVAVYPAEDAAGFGPALQVVTDQGSMLMDSVTVLLHRLGLGYTAIMTPVFEVRRDPSGSCSASNPKPTTRRPTSAKPGSMSSCPRRSTAKSSPRSSGCCPRCSPTCNASPPTRRR